MRPYMLSSFKFGLGLGLRGFVTPALRFGFGFVFVCPYALAFGCCGDSFRSPALPHWSKQQQRQRRCLVWWAHLVSPRGEAKHKKKRNSRPMNACPINRLSMFI